MPLSNIPTVTQDDLHAFRARIFGDVSIPSESFQGPEEEEDGLGYYPDGVKRTLTDEQIAMFRHSEIYSLLRERRLKLEREEDAEVKEDAEETPSVNHPEGTAADPKVPQLLEEGVEGRSEENDGEEYAQFLAAEQRDLQAQATRKIKRKRETGDGLDERSKPPTARRIAREMDESVADNTMLDYGEEDNAVAVSKLSQQNIDESNGRSRVSYEDAAEPVQAGSITTENNPILEGRKIWWPLIGGS